MGIESWLLVVLVLLTGAAVCLGFETAGVISTGFGVTVGVGCAQATSDAVQSKLRKNALLFFILLSH
jgi:hypothetical protein